MKTAIVEVSNGGKNWGKFLVGAFDSEWNRCSALKVSEELSWVNRLPLLSQRGHGTDAHLVLDLETCEGAIFRLPSGGIAEFDLEKHAVWVCPMFEPFLKWLYANFTTLEALPEFVDLPGAGFAMQGHRRAGAKHTKRKSSKQSARSQEGYTTG